MGTKVVVVALMMLAAVHSLSLTELWRYEVGDGVEGLAFSDDGKLGIASHDNCAYILDQNGNLLNMICGNGDMSDASYSNGTFSFVNGDDYAYLFNGTTFWKKVYVGDGYDSAITVLPDGFIACAGKCVYLDFNRSMGWDVYVGWVENGPAVYERYIYVADHYWNKLLILSLSNGSIVNEISYWEHAWDAAVCGNYLAVGTSSYLYLYDVSNPVNPREL